MQRTVCIFSFEGLANLKDKLLAWAQQFETVVWFDSNHHHQNYTSYDSILAVEEFTSMKTDFTQAFDILI